MTMEDMVLGFQDGADAFIGEVEKVYPPLAQEVRKRWLL